MSFAHVAFDCDLSADSFDDESLDGLLHPGRLKRVFFDQDRVSGRTARGAREIVGGLRKNASNKSIVKALNKGSVASRSGKLEKTASGSNLKVGRKLGASGALQKLSTRKAAGRRRAARQAAQAFAERGTTAGKRRTRGILAKARKQGAVGSAAKRRSAAARQAAQAFAERGTTAGKRRTRGILAKVRKQGAVGSAAKRRSAAARRRRAAKK